MSLYLHKRKLSSSSDAIVVVLFFSAVILSLILGNAAEVENWFRCLNDNVCAVLLQHLLEMKVAR